MNTEPAIILDTHSLHNLETAKGGFTRATIIALGKTWPPRKGWLVDLIGEEIPESQYLAAYKGRLITAKDNK